MSKETIKMTEKLDWITLEKKHVNEFKEETRPNYTEEDRKILAWSISWDGHIGIGLTRKTPRIGITNTEFELLEKIKKIAKLGRIGKGIYKPHGFGRHSTKKWYILSYREVLFVLENITPYIPSNRKRKIAQLTIEYIKSRLTKHDNKLPLNHDKRELEIIQTVHELNAKKLK